MKKVRNLLLVLLAAVLCLLLLTGCGEKDVTVSVTLVNRSGREISSISITPSTSTEWDTEFVDGAFADGETISANLGTYKESEVPSAYNILVYNDENYILYDTSIDELDFAIQDGDYIIFLPPEGEVPIEIAHDYDPSDYDEADETAYAFEETEPTLSGDLSGYTGCWKLAGSRSTSSSTRTTSGSPSTSTASRSAPATSWTRARTSRSAWRMIPSSSPCGRRPTAL